MSEGSTSPRSATRGGGRAPAGRSPREGAIASSARAPTDRAASADRRLPPYIRDTPPTLSLAITAGGPPERVRALLMVMRPYVDEIVLAVDRGRGPAALDACADLVDRRLTFDVADSPAGLIGWVLNQCSCDWILRLDDDEVPSRALLDALPALMRDRRPVDAAVGRRWLYPTADRFVTTHPWGSETLYRVRQNLPGLWSFTGEVHDDGAILGPKRFLDTPIYHLDLILQTEAQRRQKALRYEALRRGFAFEGVDVNALYLPELVADIETAPVPAADRDLIARVVAGSVPDDAPRGGAPIRHASSGEVTRYNSHRSASPGAYRATLRFRQPPRSLPAATQRHFDMLVRNDGDERWSWQDDLPLRLGYRYRDQATGRVVIDGRSELPETVEPGEEILAPLATLTPATPGEYTLEADMVHEHVRWFGAEIRTPVTVDETQDPIEAAMRRGAFDAELRAEHDRLRREAAALRWELDETRRALETVSARADDARAAAAAADQFKRTRRYRVARSLAAPLDALRRRMSRRRR